MVVGTSFIVVVAKVVVQEVLAAVKRWAEDKGLFVH